MKKIIKTIIFDLGGVLIDWNPEYVFLDAFNGDREKMKWFFDTICTTDWNENQDAGYPIEKATQDLIALYPQYENFIKMYYGNWEKMLGGAIDETVSIFKKIHEQKKYQIVALTNWSAETFPIALKRFEFLHWFEGIVVSGEEKTRKPFKQIYNITIDRFNITPSNAIFIDDSLRNIKAARELGIHGIHFTGAQSLKNELRNFNINL